MIYKTKHQILDIFTTILSVLEPSLGVKSFERWFSPSSSEIMTRVQLGLPRSSAPGGTRAPGSVPATAGDGGETPLVTQPF